MARDLKLFYLYRLLATSYMWVPIFVFFMISRGLSFDEIMVLSAIYCGVVVFAEVPTGALADRLGRRRSMMMGSLAMVASCLCAYWAYSFSVFVVAEVLAAISMCLCSGADSAYLFDLLEDHGRGDEYPQKEGMASVWHQGGNAVAFALGGCLGEVSLALPYIATAIASSAAFFVAFFMRGESVRQVQSNRPPVAEELKNYLHHMWASMRDVLRSRALAWVILYSAVVFVLLRMTIYLYQPYLDARGFGIAETGFVFSGIYVIAMFAAHQGQFLRRLLGEEVLLWGILIALVITFLALSQFAGPWVLCVFAVQAGTKGLYSPLIKPILNREIPESSRRATVLSVESIARRLAMGVFSIIAGFYGANSALYLCGAFAFAGLLGLAFLRGWMPQKKRSNARKATVSTPANAMRMRSID